MALRRQPGRSRLTLAVLVLASVTVITLDFRGPEGLVGSLRDGAADLVSPVRDASVTALRPVGDAIAGITGYGALEDDNAALRRRVEELEGDRLRAEDAETELEALLDQRGLDRFTTLPTVAARVVGTPVANFEQTIELDRGRDDGISEDMPVVTGTGLVGRVVDTSRSRAVVRLVTDPASAVGVRLSRSGDIGVAEGVGPGRLLDLGLIDVDTDVVAGELVVTSGVDDSFFPGGIPLGSVVTAASAEGELEQEIAVAPVVDLDRLRFVEVLQTGAR